MGLDLQGRRVPSDCRHWSGGQLAHLHRDEDAQAQVQILLSLPQRPGCFRQVNDYLTFYQSSLNKHTHRIGATALDRQISGHTLKDFRDKVDIAIAITMIFFHDFTKMIFMISLDNDFCYYAVMIWNIQKKRINRSPQRKNVYRQSFNMMT